MKNAFKLFGIAVLVTAIGFSAASCKNNEEITITVTGIPGGKVTPWQVTLEKDIVNGVQDTYRSNEVLLQSGDATFNLGSASPGTYTVILNSDYSAGKKSISAGNTKIPFEDFKRPE